MIQILWIQDSIATYSVYKLLEKRVRDLDALGDTDLCKQNRVGLEKECLRVSEQGTIATTPHPRSLGSALTNPFITTDYSEALLEFITPPEESSKDALNFLRDIQVFAYSKLENELLWCTSMPCVLSGEDSIAIAEYGKSNAGMMKTIYRRGLGYRYSRMMQVIAGIHFNYSLSDTFWHTYQDLLGDNSPRQTFVSENYLKMIRNLQRLGWMVPYLFGASPAVCRSFMDGIEKVLKPFDEFTYYDPYATSLRLGDIGYQNYKEGKSGIKADYNSLDNYINSLRHAINTVSPDYEKIGVKINGEYRQLNTNLLQIENEYYSTIRPKQVTGRFEKPTTALAKRGVQYVELRSLDVNVFEPLGANLEQLHFLEMFLVFCLLHDSPPISLDERKEIDKNQLDTAHRGRSPEFKLHHNGNAVSLKQWALELIEAMQPVCELMDKSCDSLPYRHSLEVQRAKIVDAELTPSAKILQHMTENKQSFYPFSMEIAKQYAADFSKMELDDNRKTLFNNAVEMSLQKQQEMESADTLSFDDFLQQYFAETLTR